MEVPYIQAIEAVASDASIPGRSYIHNSWGQHQPRITQHTDGSTRILYLSTDAERNVIWRLMLRKPTGAWSLEATGTSNDDVMLIRDPLTDKAHVLAWPAGIPTITTFPDAIPNVIPGSWGVYPPTARHYAALGVASDGTTCLKASKELYREQSTLRTSVEYECGTYSSATKAWNWSPFVSHYVGPRFTYDYIFPAPQGLSRAIYGMATSDLYKEVTEVPDLDTAYGNYVFNGIRAYSMSIDSDRVWSNRDIRIARNAPKEKALDTKVSAPAMRLQDALIDSQGRSFSAFFVDDSSAPGVRGLFLAVSDRSGALVFESKLKLPNYGYVRLYEDAKNRMWLLWCATGSQASQFYLYPIIESAKPPSSGSPAAFELGKYTDLSASFSSYVLYDNLYLAVPRGGNDRSQYLDVIFNACSSQYVKGTAFDGTQCYGADGAGRQRVFYMRIALPL